MRGAAALSFSSPFPSLWLPSRSSGRTKPNKGGGVGGKRSRGCDSIPNVPGCWSGARCSPETLKRSDDCKQGLQQRQRSNVSPYRSPEVAEVSPGVSSAHRGIKQGAYSWQNWNYSSQRGKCRRQSVSERENSSSFLVRNAALWAARSPISHLSSTSACRHMNK